MDVIIIGAGNIKVQKNIKSASYKMHRDKTGWMNKKFSLHEI